MSGSSLSPAWRPPLPLALPPAWLPAAPPRPWLDDGIRSSRARPPPPSFLQAGEGGDSLLGGILGRLQARPVVEPRGAVATSARRSSRELNVDPDAVKGMLQSLLPLLPEGPDAARGGRPQAPGRPAAPARPISFDFDYMAMLTAIARMAMMSSTLLRYAPNPTYNMMFMDPNLLMPPVPMPPAPYREPKDHKVRAPARVKGMVRRAAHESAVR